jgi:gamma-glutamylcyclotransferase (GGCT)/AIG2-like uncharacterized protein YtfP
MRLRAPSAIPIVAAVLPEYRLTFESNEPMGLQDAYFANVRPSAVCAVPGAVYELDEPALHALDAYEEVSRGVYRRVMLHVSRADGTTEIAVVYRMAPLSIRPLRCGMPSLRQLRQIRRGYADWGLDTRVLEAALSSVSAKIS